MLNKDDAKIGVVTIPLGKSGIVPLSNLIKVLLEQSNNPLYIITGNDGSTVSNIDSRVRVISISHQQKQIFFSRIISYTITQVRISLSMFKVAKSVDEWFYLWPNSMRPSLPNLHGNRRLFCSYEPFIANKVVKIAAAVPQRWKLNRRLFQRMAKPQLEPAKHLLHAEGWMPYYPWYVNFFISHAIRVWREFQVTIGLIEGNQGPWGDWNALMHSEKWRNLVANSTNYSHEDNPLQTVFVAEIAQLFRDDKLSVFQKLNLFQVIYLLRTHE